jgi:hypothetical protein
MDLELALARLGFMKAIGILPTWTHPIVPTVIIVTKFADDSPRLNIYRQAPLGVEPNVFDVESGIEFLRKSIG